MTAGRRRSHNDRRFDAASRPAAENTGNIRAPRSVPITGPAHAPSGETTEFMNPESFKLLISIVLLALAPFAAGQDEPPPPPGEVFRYVVFDAGDALEIDWAVEDGYYMYRDWFGFETATAGIELATPEMPAGKVYDDEFLGEQVIYRGNFLVRIPYSVAGSRPETLDLVIDSRGCSDTGFCYMPQTWTETVELAAAKPKLSLGDLDGLGAGGGSSGGMDEFPPPEEVFHPDVYAVDGNTVEIGIRIEPGFYIYKDKIRVRALGNKAEAGRLDLPKGKVKVDEFFGEQEVYLDDVLWRQAIARATPEAMDLELELDYQGCAEAGLCYTPQTTRLTVSLPEATTVSALGAGAGPGAPVSEQGRLAAIITGSSLWVAAGVFFLAGLGLAFTPCVLPMVPILSGIIAGDGDNVSPMRGFTLALAYVMGMAIVYTLAGVAAAAAGVQLQAMFNQPWVLILFSALFVALSLAMFGLYELQMPSSVQSKLSSVSGNQKSGTMIGAFVMGAISSLVVTACVAPALIAALTVMAQTGDMVRGGAALFAMSLGMGAPLLLVGAAQGQLLPKAGPWMVAVKGAFGFMFLGLAIWMLSRILPGIATMALWALLAVMAGVFMGGLTTIGTESTAAQKLGKGFGVITLAYGLALFVGVLAGGSNPLKPLEALTATRVAGPAGSVVEEDAHAMFKRIKSSADLDREIQLAAAAGKSALLDFYADWCVSCKEMEAFTFPDPAVRAALDNTVMLQADVTANDAIDKELLDRFGVFGPPTIIFFGPDGQQRHGYEVVGYMKAKDFANHVNQALASTAVTAGAE